MKSIMFLFCIFSLLCGKMLIAEERSDFEKSLSIENVDGVFLTGGIEIFNKTSFHTKQILPSNSYGYVLGDLNVGYKYKFFEVMLGGVAAGLTYDSTRGLAYNYVGYYPGWNLNQEPTRDNTSNIFIHNAFIKFDNDMVNVKLGRFQQEDDDWFDSYAEGANIVFKFAKYWHIKLFGSTTVALVGNGWLTDFSTVYSTYGIVNAEAGFKNDTAKFDIYVYYGYREYVAPGFNLNLNFGTKDFIAYNTKITAIFPIHPASIVDIGNYYFNGFKDPTGFTSSILVRQDIDFFDTYKVALAIYKNIGNANARIGLFGNPIGIDIWDNSVYTTGASLNASVAPDALSVLLFTEARWDNLAKWVKSLSVGIDGRYTTAPSADEYSLKLLVDWGITDTIKLGVIINYYTHFMYSSAWDNEGVVSGNHILDRSYLMTNIAYNF